MEATPKMIKYLNSVNSNNWFQLELEQSPEPSFTYSSAHQFSSSFGSFAYNDQFQTVNLQGKLKYNSEKEYYELKIESGRVEISSVNILGFSSGSRTVWEGDSLMTAVEIYQNIPIWFYNDTSSRFERNPNPTLTLDSVKTPPLFCKFDNGNRRGTFNLGQHWMSFVEENTCLIF